MSRQSLYRGGARGRPPQRERGRGTPIPLNATHKSHITTVGVPRPGFGVAGKTIQVTTNFFKTTIPDRVIHHYDVISADEKKLPARVNLAIITELQTYAAPNVFSPAGAYDGRKNLFSTARYSFGDEDQKEFLVTYPRASDFPSGSKKPKVYKVKLTLVAQINPEGLQRFIEGKQSYDSVATTAITAMNVAARMEPSKRYTFNARSFFIEDDRDREVRDLGNGLQLWQGYFQSIRPAGNRMMINIDIATGVVFDSGPLIMLCLSHLKKRGVVTALVPKASGGLLEERDRLKIQRFTHGLRILTRSGFAGSNSTPRVVRKFTTSGADVLYFTHNGKKKSVAQYYHELVGQPLQFPKVICVEVGNGALIPLELCTVISGQLARQQVPADCARDMVAFASKKPEDRLRKIRQAPQKLCYSTSTYIRDFGLSSNPEGPVSIKARVMDAPSLAAKELNRQGATVPRNFVPKNGAWNMDQKKFYAPAASGITTVAFFSLESTERFGLDDINACFIVLRSVLKDLGITLPSELPMRRPGNPQVNIIQQLENFIQDVKKKKGAPPQLLVVILPEVNSDLYTRVKHFCDVHMGIVTQCLRASRCRLVNPKAYDLRKPCKAPDGSVQYYSNVSLKINVKLGGVNMALADEGAGSIIDPLKPTIIMGADAVHPAPGATNKPSYTALVGNTDARLAKFVAETRVQDSRMEIIHDLKDMAANILRKWSANRKLDQGRTVRLLFYRDGVSEGQFPKVLEQEALQEVHINAKITFIVVAKRHHVRFFPRPNDPNAVKGNCPPGTVVDQEICHPAEFDFYLQSHAGILGTSRPAHYSVLYDDNEFSPDTLQKFTYHLCYTYARATRAVSIPAPVYYADIVCSRAKNHYDPYVSVPEADPTLVDKADKDLESHKAAFKPLHEDVANLMYFS